MKEYSGSNSDKNIYGNRSKMERIIKHCKENKIKVCESFINRLPDKED